MYSKYTLATSNVPVVVFSIAVVVEIRDCSICFYKVQKLHK